MLNELVQTTVHAVVGAPRADGDGSGSEATRWPTPGDPCLADAPYRRDGMAR